VPFLEIFAEAPLEVLEARDVKGLYRKARAGTIHHFTGISDPYEPPTHPEVTVHTGAETVEQSAGVILDYLERHGLTGPRV
jgi:adenylylsulfate kinase